MASPQERDFTILYMEESERVERFVRSRVRLQEDRADIVQEVWTRLHLRLQQPEPLENPQAWLMRVARNLVTDHYRRQATRRAVFQETEETPDYYHPGEAEPDQEVTNEELRARLEEGLNRLSPAHREAFIATELQGRSFQELAEETDVKMGTLLSRKHYAVRMLRKLLRVVYEEFRHSI